MLINALCDYYDILAREGKVVEEGYSKVDVSYLIALSPDGKIEEIIDSRTEKSIPTEKGKTKISKEKKTVIMPRRTEKPGIDGNIIEHRPLYIFGLNYDTKKSTFSVEDKTNKAKKSHAAFVEVNLGFIDGLSSPLINAYRCFIENWKPEEETENECLLALGREYASASYAFCLSGYPDKFLNDEPIIKERWELSRLEGEESDDDGEERSQCAVTGRTEKIARIHDKIKGVSGGQATGNVLIGYKSPAGCSYGHEQSYNSNISESAMKKYTCALNSLLGSPGNKVTLDDVTVVFWAMSTNEAYANDIKSLLGMMSVSDKMDAAETEQMLKEMIYSSKTGKIVSERLTMQNIDPNVDFYILGIKPNVARISVKFIYRRRYAEFLMNIARFQEELRVTDEIRPVSVYRIKRELVSPKSTSEKVNPVMISKLLEAMLTGTPYPASLLETTVRRVKTDVKTDENGVRVGIIKAYINRNHEKEEIKVGLDRENKNQAYLCGRLFAIYEKLQQDASGGGLKRTIRDAYFASASSKPLLVFPKLARLSNYHLGKTEYPAYYGRLIGEVMSGLEGGFPETLPLVEQGKFIVGYYQQSQSFFEKNAEKNKEEN
ncbi:MAG: type I-C CRISPR-associated protein Cas8c/Csd1 [Firmicutes bacterium]|nr:type I-C CRISPR-associated protein Cas8c/Csd1 [Bacillota bacterium]